MGNVLDCDNIKFEENDINTFEDVFQFDDEYNLLIKELRTNLNNPIVEEIEKVDYIVNEKLGSENFKVYKGEVSYKENNKIKNGYGKIINQKGEYFEGYYTDDERNGKGFIIYIDKSYYFGEFKNNKFNGIGTHIFSSKQNNENLTVKLEGVFKDGIFLSGKKYINNYIYEGDFKNNKLENKGKIIYNDTVYDGQIVNEVSEGQGVLENKDVKYTGEFHQGRKHGHGKQEFKDIKNFYEGQFWNDNMHGNGEMTIKGKIFKVKMCNNKIIK